MKPRRPLRVVPAIARDGAEVDVRDPGRANLLRLLLWGMAASGVAPVTPASAAEPAEIHRVRGVVLHSRQMGAHGLGYGERSLHELSQKLTPADIPILIALIDDKNRSAAIGATFGLASQCGAAIDPVYAMTAGAAPELKRYGEARDVLAQLANYARCTPPEREHARESSAMIDRAERDFRARRTKDITRREAQDARLQAEGMKMLDPVQRASVSHEDCLAVAERNRAATGIKPGANADSDALFERAKSLCQKQASRP